jgi:hypothetical protein
LVLRERTETTERAGHATTLRGAPPNASEDAAHEDADADAVVAAESVPTPRVAVQGSAGPKERAGTERGDANAVGSTEDAQATARARAVLQARLSMRTLSEAQPEVQ